MSSNPSIYQNDILPDRRFDWVGSDALSGFNPDSTNLNLAEYFRTQTRRYPIYQGQLGPAFQNELALHHKNIRPENCDFYHTMDFPDGRVFSGEWDLRGHEARYLGGAVLGEGYFQGKRVAEIGPASGALTAYLAKQASEVVVFDLPFGLGPELVPFPQIDMAEAARSGVISAERLRNSWWYGKSALGYPAKAVYTDIYNLPDDIGRFSVAIFGCILLHLSNPFRALQKIASNVDDTIIVTEIDSAPSLAGFSSEDRDYPSIAAFNEGKLPSGLVHWWSFSPHVIVKMLERLGFETVDFDRHVPTRMNTDTKLFTVVGRRRRPDQAKSSLAKSGLAESSLLATPRLAAGVISLPPAAARFLVSGTEQISEFSRLGRAGFQALSNSLGKVGISVENAGRVLDFGCGVGRVLRYWADYPNTEIHGCDYQQDAIEWCKENIPFGHFTVNKLWPDLPYPNDYFDVVYALSVFTHLPGSAQLPWLAELSRILKPGGVIYFSVHGAYYAHLLDSDKKAGFASGQVIVTGEDQPGTNICAAFHPPQYVNRNFIDNFGFSLLEHVECGALGNPKQDSYLIRKANRRTNAA